MVTVIIKINSHTVRSLASLDKKLSFSCDCVEEDDIKEKFAEFLTKLPADSCIKATFELSEE